MSGSSQFARTLKTDIKRMIKSLSGFLVTAAIFVVMAGVIIYYAKNFVFDNDKASSVKVAYFVNSGDELGQGQIDIIKNMESVKESAALIPVESEDAGRRMLKDKEVDAFLVVPGNFVDDMGDEDSAIKVFFNEDESFESYLVNDIVTIISELYHTERMAVLTYREVARDNGFEDEQTKKGYNSLNTRLMTDVFARTGNYKINEIDSVGMYSIEQIFTCSMLILIMFLMCFQLTSYYKGHNRAYKMLQKISGVNEFKLAVSNLICGTLILYTLYLIIFILLLLFKRGVRISSLITIIPVLLLIAGLTLCLSNLIESEHVVNIVIFLGVVVLIYLAGGFVPILLMPEFMYKVAKVNPMTYLLDLTMRILY